MATSKGRLLVGTGISLGAAAAEYARDRQAI